MKRGRPEKRPGYNREEEIQKLITTAVNLAVEPFDDREERDDSLPTVTGIARMMDTTFLRVRKLLITADFFSSSMSRRVQRLNAQGMSIREIMEETGLGRAAADSYLPHRRGAYYLETPTIHSECSKRYRMRRAAVEELENHRRLTDDTFYLWKAICAFENYSFTTSGRGSKPGVAFSYTVSAPGGPGGRKYAGPEVEGYGNEMWISTGEGVGVKEKSISRSTVELAYRNALKLMDTEGEVRGPKSLGVPGAGSYLYSVFQKFGVITSSQPSSTE